MIEIQADDLCIQQVVGVPDRPTGLRGILHFKLFESLRSNWPVRMGL